MAFIDWEEDYSVGVNQMDIQHKMLVELINKLHKAMSEGKGKDVLSLIFDEMIKYSETHFRDEESLMNKYFYAGITKQTEEHSNFVKEAVKLKEKFEKGAMLISIEVLNFLKNWLIHHILEVDMDYKRFLNTKGIN